MRINNNVSALNAWRNLTTTNTAMGKSLEKLSSGFRINRAADDASGLVISQSLHAQISGLKQATRNAQDGISLVQTAEGALNEVHTMLNRMRDLAVQAANTGTMGDTAVQAAQDEFNQLRQEISRIATSTSFGSQKLLDGTFADGVTSYQTHTPGTGSTGSFVAANAGAVTGTGDATITVAIDGTTTTFTVATGTAVNGPKDIAKQINLALAEAGASALARVDGDKVTIDNSGSDAVALAGDFLSTFTGGGANASAATNSDPIVGAKAAFQVGAYEGDTIEVAINRLDDVGLGINLLDLAASPGGAITALDSAIDQVSKLRGELGAVQNRFESTITNLQVTTENLVASESRIRDVDMASEMTNFTKNQVLIQAGTAMLGQANSLTQSVLSLLQ